MAIERRRNQDLSYFSNETAVRHLGDGRFEGTVGSHWSIGDNPNGGYLVSIALMAFRELVPAHPDPLTVTAHYLRPGVPDTPFEVTAEVVRTGRSLSTGRMTLMQEGKTRIEVLAAFGELGDVTPRDTDILLPAPQLPDPDRCPQRSGEEQGIHLPLLDRLDIRIHPDQAKAGAAGEPVVSGYIRFRDDQPPDTIASILMADSFPPSVFGSHGVIGWVPTIELTVHVRRRAAPGWLVGSFRTNDLADGRMIESGALWDSTGALVAQSRQIGLLLTTD